MRYRRCQPPRGALPARPLQQRVHRRAHRRLLDAARLPAAKRLIRVKRQDVERRATITRRGRPSERLSALRRRRRRRLPFSRRRFPARPRRCRLCRATTPPHRTYTRTPCAYECCAPARLMRIPTVIIDTTECRRTAEERHEVNIDDNYLFRIIFAAVAIISILLLLFSDIFAIIFDAIIYARGAALPPACRKRCRVMCAGAPRKERMQRRTCENMRRGACAQKRCARRRRHHDPRASPRRR